MENPQTIGDYLAQATAGASDKLIPIGYPYKLTKKWVSYEPVTNASSKCESKAKGQAEVHMYLYIYIYIFLYMPVYGVVVSMPLGVNVFAC